MTTPTKPYHYTQARQTKDGKSLVIDMRFLEALLEHNRVFKVQPVTPRGRK